MRNKTPKQMGYRMPAEFEKQSAMWIAWPINEDTWPNMIEKVEKSFLEFVKLISQGQKVKILSKNKYSLSEKLKNNGINLEKIEFFNINYVDSWIRDYGPTFVTRPDRLAMIDWIYNAWGNKYTDLKDDNIIPNRINRFLEGGSIEVNGTGTLLTTEQCLSNKNRNAHLKKEEIEKYLEDNLNVSNILWLKEGIIGDDTDGHIDDIARFVNKNTVVCAYEENEKDKNHKILKKNFELLQSFKDENGNPFNVIKLPMPDPVIINDIRLPASYANFYIGNAAVAVPIFGCEKDKIALEILQKLFPGRKAVGINCKDLVFGLGALHCLSQQEPKWG
jgi:agmatine deiminase